MLRQVTLLCGHSSCQGCLANLVKKSKPKPCCPLCRTAFASDVTRNVNIAFNNLMCKLGFACTNLGCSWTGKYENAEDHSKHCPKQKVNCVNKGCQEVLTQEDVELHSRSCSKQTIYSTKCEMLTTRESSPHHVETLCLYKIISCPLDCGENLPRCCWHRHVWIRA